MTDFIVKAAVVRNEIAGVMKSERLTLMGSVEAHVFKLEDGKWIDLTTEPVLVHLIRDNLEGVTKMLAVHIHKLIIDNVPVSSNFNVYTPSKKFVQFVCNKFDKNTSSYGFGFGSLPDVEQFLQILNRIKQMAMASLTPTLFSNDLSAYMPPQNNNSYSIPPGLSVPFGFTSSPMKANLHPADLPPMVMDPFVHGMRQYEMEEPLSPLSEEGLSHFSGDKSLENEKITRASSDSHTMSNAEVDFPEFVPNERSNTNLASPSLAPGLNPFGTHGRASLAGMGGGDSSMYSFAERRLCDLLASFDAPIPQGADTPNFHGSMGPIGSPVKRNG